MRTRRSGSVRKVSQMDIGDCTVTLCPACLNAAAAVRPAIPAPTIRTSSFSYLSVGSNTEPILLSC